MSGSQYIALSALRTRMAQLDQLSSDLANVDTAGYRTARTMQVAAKRREFADALGSAVDTASGPTRIDLTPGTIAPTGRPLDVAIEGDGFFVVESRGVTQYTRNGHFQRAVDGTLVSADGGVVQGEDGPIKLGAGEARIDDDGKVWSGNEQVGQLVLGSVKDPAAMQQGEGAFLLPGDQEVETVDDVRVKSGVLEQSNVLMSEGLARLTMISRSFEALQRSISMVLNDVDGRFIDQIGRR